MAIDLLALTLLALAQSQAPAAPQGESPLEEFTRIGRALYENDCPSVGGALARTIENALRTGLTDPLERLDAQCDLGRAWVDLGKVDEAIALLELVLAQAEQRRATELVKRAHRLLALSYLRLAEDKNCVERHAAACCILPLGDGALHAVREPGLAARKHYLAVLAAEPDNLAARWLLNVLGLLLGDYPDGVPEEHRIPMDAFTRPDGAPLFRDVASRAGMSGLALSGGSATEDFDGDGWIDVLTSTSDPLGALRYYRNKGDGTFEDRSRAAGTHEQLGGLNLIAGDYDNDGDPDALVLRGGWMLDHGRIRRSLLRNDAGASFADVTRAAGLAEPAYPSQAALFADLDDDGRLDLYVGNECRLETDGGGPFPSQLFLSKSDGTFRDVAAEAGVTNMRYAKGVAAGDYDDDGDLDLYVSNNGKNRLYRNDGKVRFEDVAREAGAEAPAGRSFATWFFDYDNDGRLDLWVGAYNATIADLAAEALGQPWKAAPPCLYHNEGGGKFRGVATALGLARPMLPMGANFGDVDNDGWLDFYLGTGDPLLQSLMPNLLFRNEGGKRFADLTAASGLGHLQKGHGVAFADFDHDGDQDLFHQLGGFVRADRFQATLFENAATGGHWLSLALQGTRSNRDGVGARIAVVVATPAGPRTIHRAAGAVSSFGGSTHRQEIGLGDATRIERLEIRWPRTKEPQVFTDVPLDAWIAVTEGAAELVRVERRSFRF